MGCDIYVYSLLEIIHKEGIAYIKLFSTKRYTHGAEHVERWDQDEKRTAEQQQAFEDTFLEVDFIDCEELYYQPTLIYENYSDNNYNKENFSLIKYYEKYDSLLDEKIQSHIENEKGDYMNENNENYTENDKRYNIVEKGLFKSKDDIVSIHKIIQKKWSI